MVTPGLRKALAEQIARVRALEEASREGIGMLHPTSQPCIEAARVLDCGIVNEVEAIDFEVFTTGPPCPCAAASPWPGPPGCEPCGPGAPPSCNRPSLG